MKIPPLPFTVTNWRCCSNRSSRRDRTRHLAHLRRFGVRRVEYTAGNRADQWCDLYDMSFAFSKANSIPNFAMDENSSYCRRE